MTVRSWVRIGERTSHALCNQNLRSFLQFINIIIVVVVVVDIIIISLFFIFIFFVCYKKMTFNQIFGAMKVYQMAFLNN